MAMEEKVLESFLLIENKSLIDLFLKIKNVSGFFLLPLFTLSLSVEFLTNFEFEKVIKKLIISTLFLSFFQGIHVEVTKSSLDFSSSLLREVSPDHFILKKWYREKLKTKEKKTWDFFERLTIPNINDLVANALFVLSRIFLFFLKLIFSTIYHFTYILSPIGALLFLFDMTESSLKGFILSSLWCALMPLVLVCILSMVGNTLNTDALNSDLTLTHIDSLIWLFGITFLLLLSPVITLGILSSSGISSHASLFGAKMMGSSLQTIGVVKSLNYKSAQFGRKAIYTGKRLVSKASSIL